MTIIDLVCCLCLLGVVFAIAGLAINDPLFPLVRNEKLANRLSYFVCYPLSLVLCVATVFLIR
jgi:hypothetical protein